MKWTSALFQLCTILGALSDSDAFSHHGIAKGLRTTTGKLSTSLDSTNYSIETSNTGPAEGIVHSLTINSLPGQRENDTEPIVNIDDGYHALEVAHRILEKVKASTERIA